MNSSLEPRGQRHSESEKAFCLRSDGKRGLGSHRSIKKVLSVHEQYLLDQDLVHLVIAPWWWLSSWWGSLTPSSSPWCCPSPTMVRYPPDLCCPGNWKLESSFSAVDCKTKICLLKLHHHYLTNWKLRWQKAHKCGQISKKHLIVPKFVQEEAPRPFLVVKLCIDKQH